MKVAALKLAFALTGASLIAGCTGLRDHRGSVIDKELASAVQVGVDNKDSVTKTLGRPSFVGQFSPNDWYYVSRDTRTVAFRDPKVLDQTVLHVRFDQAGNVALVDRSGKELIASIDPVNAKTPTLGRKKSFFEDMFGGIGSISQPGLPGSQQ
jgi:outer membrane protein assembly factor BamE (lipoprotein component of BamABCDE complex)